MASYPTQSQNPAQTPGWTNGDPGWDHAVRFGYLNAGGDIDYSTNGVYLGDGWVLTAAHVGIPTNVQFPSGAVLHSCSASEQSGPVVSDRQSNLE